MEQHKLLDWARIAHLSETDASLSTGLRLSKHAINEVLYQIESLLLDLNGLGKKYKLNLAVDQDPATEVLDEKLPSQVSTSASADRKKTRLDKLSHRRRPARVILLRGRHLT